MRRKNYYVYILQCSTGEYYTGYTTNLKRRLKTHNDGRGARFTKGRLPVKLVYSERHESRSQAMRRERQLKRKPRREKIELTHKL